MDVEKRRCSCKKKKEKRKNLVSIRRCLWAVAESRNCARLAIRWLQSYFETIKTIRINERREVMQIFTLILNHFGVAIAMVADDWCQTVLVVAVARCRWQRRHRLDVCLRTWAIIAALNIIIIKIAAKSISIVNRCTCSMFAFVLFFSLSFVLNLPRLRLGWCWWITIYWIGFQQVKSLFFVFFSSISSPWICSCRRPLFFLNRYENKSRFTFDLICNLLDAFSNK